MANETSAPAFPAAQTQNGKYLNSIETDMSMPPGKMASVMWRMLKGVPGREPATTIPTLKFDPQAYNSGTSETLFSWFGHSSLLLRFQDRH